MLELLPRRDVYVLDKYICHYVVHDRFNAADDVSHGVASFRLDSLLSEANPNP